MPLYIDGVSYVTVPEILGEMQITRQTLWRWRLEGRIPKGRRYRSQQLLFTVDEAAAIRRYSNRVEPIGDPDSSEQLHLFAPVPDPRSSS
jgi:hypothetical protein